MFDNCIACVDLEQAPPMSTPTSTALGKRPLGHSSLDSQPPTAKASRLDVDALIASLEEDAAALAKIGGEALSKEQHRRVAQESYQHRFRALWDQSGLRGRANAHP